jgi:signal transduction histidine kinase
MLKNLKVGTKLVAILVAPVLVLLLLAVVGVNQRMNEASDAERVSQLTEFTGATSLLVKELQLEGLYSSVYTSTGGTRGKTELDTQRAKTDAALAGYADSLETVQPGRDDEAVAESVKQADNRLLRLDTNRRSVDSVQTDALGQIGPYQNTTAALLDVNLRVAYSVDDPELARGLQTVSNLATVTQNESRVASILSISVEIGFYASVLPKGADPRTEKGLCGDDAEGAKDSCPVYAEALSANVDKDQAEVLFLNTASGEQKQTYRAADAGSEFDQLKANAFENGNGINDMRGTVDGSEPIDPEKFLTSAANRIDRLFQAQEKMLASGTESVQSIAATKASDARQGAVVYALLTIIAILVAGLITASVARATTGPLKKLTSAAYTLSTERLPALVERLRNPEADDGGESLSAQLTPIDINSKDEIGQLADAFNSIQQVTVEVAEEQSVLLRKGIGDIFINLARRNQTLLDRQIEFIDQLEANEEDPDQLDNLFKLDHLATRMRRNAESLLVLAGAEPPRRRGRPVALADVVRVAIGEVEDFARIQLLALDDATVGGNVAVDLAHLLSELMENATHFSPPDTMVEIVGHRGDSGYILSVSDQGIGMSADQINEANHQLARPPLVGLALSRSLGFIVIGRLAQRFDVSVKLTASPSGGVTALVTLPTDLVTYEGDELPSASPELAPSADRASADAPADDEFVDLDDDELVILDDEDTDDLVVIDDEITVEEDEDEVVVTETVVAEEPALADDDLLDELVEEGMSDTDEFERGLQSIISDELAPGPVESATPGESPSEPDSVPGAFGSATTTTVDDEPAELSSPIVEAAPEPVPEPAARTRAEPVVTVAEQISAASRQEALTADITAAGLVKRTPKKRAETPSFDGTAATSGAAQQPRATGASQRSPEEVRKMLSRYRSGLNKGRGSADSEKTDS